jgi:glycosyltransferase involved in cell wall biosynthesis/acetyltransferase-like isoleucine patch superfamily enzyme
MINILFIIDHVWNSNGGTEGQLLMLLNNLDPQKYRVHLFCLKKSPWSISASVNFPLKVLHINKLLVPGNISKLVQFRRYCRQNHIDIIQTYFSDALIFGVIAGRLAGVKKIIACRRNLGPGFWRKKRMLYAHRALKPFITHYMANSRATKESIEQHEGIAPRKIDVIYNGLDSRRFAEIDGRVRQSTRTSLGLDDSHILIGMVAHLRPEKNIPLFIAAAADLRVRYPQARFIVLGEGVERAILEDEIKSRNLGDIFTLAGSIMNVVPYLAAMDIGCLTSDGESFSNSIIEYQASGLPVVATAVGGNLEAVPSPEFLFPPGNQARLVRLLESLMKDRELRLQAGEAGKRFVEDRYSVSRMISGHEELYRKVQDTVIIRENNAPAAKSHKALNLRLVFKRILFAIGVLLTSPLIALTFLEEALLGREHERILSSCKELLSAIPTIVGEYLRLGYYWAVCKGVSPDASLTYGAMIAHRDTIIRRGAAIGSFTIIGYADIGENVQIASRVSIISGKYQHGLPQDRAAGGVPVAHFDKIHIGKNSWIGQHAIIMANIGENCTIGAGSVVYKDVPSNSTFIGNPARKVSIDYPEGSGK